jgi:hypothetical protein
MRFRIVPQILITIYDRETRQNETMFNEVEPKRRLHILTHLII